MFGLFKKKSSSYWNRRYKSGGTSGEGSYGRLAGFKQRVVDQFCEEFQVRSIIEFGCGDGNQLSLFQYQCNYVGLDVSEHAVRMCTERFRNDATKKFRVFNGRKGFCAEHHLAADLCLSLDVVYHLVEDSVFRDYMNELFISSKKFVILYSTNFQQAKGTAWHVRHREITTYIDECFPEFVLSKTILNDFPPGIDSGETSAANFYIYSRRENIS